MSGSDNSRSEVKCILGIIKEWPGSIGAMLYIAINFCDDANELSEICFLQNKHSKLAGV
jgi:hypothetical protein